MNKKNRQMVQLALLIGIQIVLTITPLGFLPLGFMTVTLMHIPVLVGAIVLGPSAGVTLGFVFGISSIISAHLRGGTPDVMVFSPLLSGSAWSLVISIVPRVVFPLVAAYLFILLHKKMKVSSRLSAGISAAVGTLLNTVLVLGFVYLFMGDLFSSANGIAQGTLLAFFAGIAVTNGTMEVVVAVLILMALVVPLRKQVEE